MKTFGIPRRNNNCAIALAVAVFFVFASNHATAADSDPMLYFFTSAGCAPCIQVKQVVGQLDREGYPVTTVDVNQRPDWATAFRVTRTPTLVLVRDNDVLAWQPRPMRAEELRGWFRTVGFSLASSSAPNKSAPPLIVRPVQDKVSIPAANTPASISQFSSPTIHQGTRNAQNRFEENALNATVRLQVKDATGSSFATGTVVHSHAGESLVLTCGHVFRESAGRGQITAELGFGGEVIKVPGELLDYDAEANDIALVSIRNGSHELGVADIAATGADVSRGDEVFSLGCDHGQDPTIRHSAIKNLARYDGSMKYDIFGRPVNGRSGGGLFDEEGKLIGVCNAAAVEVDEGIYTALETIHWQLAKTNLDHVFDTQDDVQGTASLIAVNQPASIDLSPSSDMVPIRRRPKTIAPGAVAKGTFDLPVSPVSPVRNVSFEEPVSANDHEVLITIRSRSNPKDSKTITISDPTPKLLDYLGAMEGDQSRSLKMAQYRSQSTR